MDAAVGLLVWLLGLCIGSFLNVLIYRLPLGLSISRPRRSFCPHCERTLAAKDNVPVLSWLLLRGRCRNCRAPISLQYPVVEATAGLVFLLAYWALCITGTRAGIPVLTLPADVPLLLAWLTLAAVLVACAGMDFAAYVVDTRVTNFAVLAGVILYAAWPHVGLVRDVAKTPLSAGLAIAFVVCAVVAWMRVRGLPEEALPQESQPPGQLETQSAPPSRAWFLLGALSTLVIVSLAAWVYLPLVLAPGTLTGLERSGAASAAFIGLFALLVSAGSRSRPADTQLHVAIEQESASARRVALAELGWLMPGIVAGAAAYVTLHELPGARAAWNGVLGWSAFGTVQPVIGVTYSLMGAAAGAGIGWLVRIVFTLAFGREAFGIGDIYILAAAGATAGWDIALLGLALAIPIALLAWLLSLLMKRTVMIPFGPPLGLGFLVALWADRPIDGRLREVWDQLEGVFSQRRDLALLSIAVMLAGAVVAVILARLVRRLVEPPLPEVVASGALLCPACGYNGLDGSATHCPRCGRESAPPASDSPSRQATQGQGGSHA